MKILVTLIAVSLMGTSLFAAVSNSTLLTTMLTMCAGGESIAYLCKYEDLDAHRTAALNYLRDGSGSILFESDLQAFKKAYPDLDLPAANVARKIIREINQYVTDTNQD